MEAGHAMMQWRPLSVCPSECPQPDPKSKIEWTAEQAENWQVESRDPLSHLEAKMSKVKVTRPLNAVTENEPYLRNGKPYELQT